LANFTPQERETIKRLQELGGFSLQDVVQYYIATDKNEDATANLLFQ
jgi:hypothetical protein